MDEDIDFAITLLANEEGIYDEELIEDLKNLFNSSDSPNLMSIDELLNENFLLDALEVQNNEIDFTHSSVNYIRDINNLRSFADFENVELININSHRMLTNQYIQNNNSGFGNLINVNMPNSPNFVVFPPNTNSFSGIEFPQFPQFSHSNFNVHFLNDNLIQSPNDNLFNILNMISSERVPVTLTDKALNEMKDLTYEQLQEEMETIDSEETCAICFSKLNEEKDKFTYSILPCNHIFHSECIKKHLSEYDHNCPICREGCGESSPKLD